MKQPEYIEGPEAKENFERMAIAVFKVPKADGRKKSRKTSKKTSDRKPKSVDKD